MAWAQFIQMGMQASANAYDAKSAETDAQNSKSQGYLTADANETRVRANNTQAIGEQRAAAVQSGFDANTGSLATLQVQSTGNLELDALTQRYEGQINGWRQDETLSRGKEKSNYIMNPFGGKMGHFMAQLNAPGRYAGKNGFGTAMVGIGASAYGAYRQPSLLNSSNSYRGLDGKRYANNDLSGTNRGSRD